MRQLAVTVLMLLSLTVGFGSNASAQVSINIRIGPPPAPRVVHTVPPRPGPSYTWVEGYWYPVDNRYVWHNGYWTRAPYTRAPTGSSRTTRASTTTTAIGTGNTDVSSTTMGGTRKRIGTTDTAEDVARINSASRTDVMRSPAALTGSWLCCGAG